MPHTPVRSRRLRSVLTGGAVPLLLLTGLPAQAHAQEAAVHTVRPGDTLTRISAARGVSVADLLRFNGLGLETVLYPGDELRLTGAAAVRCVVRTMPGWSMLDALMPLSRCSCAAETPVRRAMIHHPSFGCTV